jgi:hypothetical protein
MDIVPKYVPPTDAQIKAAIDAAAKSKKEGDELKPYINAMRAFVDQVSARKKIAPYKAAAVYSNTKSSFGKFTSPSLPWNLVYEMLLKSGVTVEAMRNISAFYHHAAKLMMNNDLQLYCLFHYALLKRRVKNEPSEVEGVYVNEALDDPDEKGRTVEPFCDLPPPNPKLIDAKATKEAAKREEAAEQEEKDRKAREKKIEETRKQKEREAEAARLKAEAVAKSKKEDEERISKSKERARASKERDEERKKASAKREEEKRMV